MNERRLYLSRDKLIGGVAGGLAEYFGLDPTIVRLLFVLGLWVHGVTIALYIAGMIIIPERPDGAPEYTAEGRTGFDNLRRAAQGLTEGNNLTGLGILLIGLGVILLLRLFVAVDWSIVLPVLLVLAGAALLFRGWRGRS
ncbi:MAG: PspC domain-containing protein [Firmicutes bacterium]|jgi:phage shock protein C|nr:PspC domain-containing protein [Bacillota bacterium]